MKFIILFLLSLLSTQLYANTSSIYIKVGDAQVRKSLMALPSFSFYGNPAAQNNYQEIGKELYQAVKNDLDSSSYFKFLSAKAFLEDTSKVGLRPAPGSPNGFHFKNWNAIGAEFLIRAGYKINKDSVELEAYLYHIPKATNILGRKYSGTIKDVRKIAHLFASDVLESLTGQKAMFTSKVVVSSDRDAKCQNIAKCTKWKEIYIMDWDAKNIRQISRHKSISISPSWSPDAKTVTYTSYIYHAKEKTRNPDLMGYEVFTGKRFLLSWRKGINSGSVHHPNGKHIYLTISNNGVSDIFRMNTDGTGLVNLTKGPKGALNVEPDISPDGKQIAFSSDRHGMPMIYIMNLDGSNIRRLTYGGKYNSTPSWSPDGTKIAFAGWKKGHFDIYTVDVNTKKLSILTTQKKSNGKFSNNEDPAWSPDGRHIMFVSDRSGEKQLYIVNPDGSNERRITFDRNNYYKPKWSNIMN